MNESKYKHLDTEIAGLYRSGLSCYKIAPILGVRSNTVSYRIKQMGISRSISEASIGHPKSTEHRDALSRSRIEKGVGRGSGNPNWKGGVTKEYEKRAAEMKRDPRYKAWKKAVRSIGYCEACGDTEKLHAHHVLPKAKFPHLIHDIDNGKCLCKKCHTTLHSGAKFHSDELLETLTVNDEGNQQPSLQSRKVQRLLETSDGLNNQPECPTRK